MLFIQMILVVPDQKKGQFERLIEAGGGQVVKGRWVESLLKVKLVYIPIALFNTIKPWL